MMVLVDTSVWVDHLRHGHDGLAAALEKGRVLTPRAPVASDPEVLEFIERRRLMGRGIGFVDAHLLASVVLAGSASLLTTDRRLAALASELRSEG